MSPPDPIWVFGYGSLVWRPAFPFLIRRAARVVGWSRRFWQASTDHRGTVSAPGRVLTLTEQPDAEVWGTCYAVAAADWPAVLERLEVREQQGYDRVEVRAGLAAGDHAGPIEREVGAVIYVATPANAHFIGPETHAATAAVVRHSHGPSGDNVSYVRELARALAEMGVHDTEVDALAELL